MEYRHPETWSWLTSQVRRPDLELADISGTVIQTWNWLTCQVPVHRSSVTCFKVSLVRC